MLSQAREWWQRHRGFVTPELLKEYLAPADKASKALLCGPPPVINAMKKTLTRLGGRSLGKAGDLPKAIDQVFLF